MEKKILLIVLLLLIGLPSVFCSITDFSVKRTVRLGENLTITGIYSSADTWCKFDIYDSNNILVERLNDIQTFSDGSFTSVKKVSDIPYFVGDDYNAVVVCGTDKNGSIFSIIQPVSLAQPIQRNFEYWFAPNNQTAVMFLVSIIAIVVVGLLIFAFVIKKVESYAS